MKVLILGGSKNIGYYTAQRLLAAGATVTFLLRNKSVFDKDESIQTFVKSGHVRISPGDALKKEDVAKAFEVAAEGDGGPIDAILFTVGGYPKFSLSKGLYLDPADLCTRSMLNVLSTLSTSVPKPKLILLSSNGLSKVSHDKVPLVLKPLYGSLLSSPHNDKHGLERVVYHSAGWTWTEKEPGPDVLVNPDWKSGIPEPGSLNNVLVVRPALLTDGKCEADAGKQYRVSDDDSLKGVYTVSRRDVAHFIARTLLEPEYWQQWADKCAQISY